MSRRLDDRGGPCVEDLRRWTNQNFVGVVVLPDFSVREDLQTGFCPWPSDLVVVVEGFHCELVLPPPGIVRVDGPVVEPSSDH